MLKCWCRLFFVVAVFMSGSARADLDQLKTGLYLYGMSGEKTFREYVDTLDKQAAKPKWKAPHRAYQREMKKRAEALDSAVKLFTKRLTLRDERDQSDLLKAFQLLARERKRAMEPVLKKYARAVNRAVDHLLFSVVDTLAGQFVRRESFVLSANEMRSCLSVLNQAALYYAPSLGGEQMARLISFLNSEFPGRPVSVDPPIFALYSTLARLIVENKIEVPGRIDAEVLAGERLAALEIGLSFLNEWTMGPMLEVRDSILAILLRGGEKFASPAIYAGARKILLQNLNKLSELQRARLAKLVGFEAQVRLATIRRSVGTRVPAAAICELSALSMAIEELAREATTPRY